MNGERQPPLNLRPSGLLDFFGIKDGGWGPRTLNPELRASFDLLDWYRNIASIDVQLNTAGATGNINGGTTIGITSQTPANTLPQNGVGQLEVPATELWILIAASVYWRFPIEASAFGEFRFDVVDGVGANTILVAHRDGTTGSSATVQQEGIKPLEQVHFLRPGALLGIVDMGSVSVGTIVVRAQLRLCRMRI